MRVIATVIIVCTMAATQSAGANATAKDWLEWFKPINSQLRTAVSYLRTGNLDLAALALEEMIATVPPEGLPSAFAKAATGAISEATRALEEIDDGNGSRARDRLLGLRETLFQTNHDNSIEVFDDCIWELRKKGPPLWYYRRNEPDFADATQRDAVERATADYLAQLEGCDAIVPADAKSDADWSRIAGSAILSLRLIKTESLPNRDVLQLIRIIRELRAFDNLLYFRYG